VVAQPIATGLLSGDYHRGKRVKGPWRTPDPTYSSENLTRTAELVETLGGVARTHGATVAQVALAYVLRHPNVLRAYLGRDSRWQSTGSRGQDCWRQ
jgi:aryl-alcohol dehydrogenase-like predicted oxidoreductase